MSGQFPRLRDWPSWAGHSAATDDRVPPTAMRALQCSTGGVQGLARALKRTRYGHLQAEYVGGPIELHHLDTPRWCRQPAEVGAERGGWATVEGKPVQSPDEGGAPDWGRARPRALSSLAGLHWPGRRGQYRAPGVFPDSRGNFSQGEVHRPNGVGTGVRCYLAWLGGGRRGQVWEH